MTPHMKPGIIALVGSLLVLILLTAWIGSRTEKFVDDKLTYEDLSPKQIANARKIMNIVMENYAKNAKDSQDAEVKPNASAQTIRPANTTTSSRQ